MYGYDELADKLDFNKMRILLTEVNNHITLINQKDAIENADARTDLINMALEEIFFSFRKISEEEMNLGIVDDFKKQTKRCREELHNNFDSDDMEYITLKEEFERIFKMKKLTEMSTEDINENTLLLRRIYEKITDLNRRNALIRAKYGNDEKFARVHKRIIEMKPDWGNRLTRIIDSLLGVKHQADDQILGQEALLDNDSYFSRTVQRLVIHNFDSNTLTLDPTAARDINNLVVREYIKEYRGI